MRHLEKLTGLIGAHGGAAMFVLARNLIAARLLGAEEFGTAAAFAILAGVVEALTALGFVQLILRDANGHSARVIATLHMLQILRGFIGAAVMLALAHPMATFLNMDHAVDAFRLLAIVPLLNGFQNLDQHRAMRYGNYRPFAWVQLAAGAISLLTLLAAYPVAPDHRAVLVALILHALTLTLTSHLVARRPYRTGIDRKTIGRATSFALPILANGALLSLVLHGEKLVIGNLLGPASLGSFALCLTLTVTPAMILAKAQQSLFLPQLSRSGQGLGLLYRLSALAACTLLLLSVLAAQPVANFFGPGFASVAFLLPLTGILASLRLLRGASVTVALAQDRPRIAIYGNIPRVLALPALFMILTQGALIQEAMWLVIAAELTGLALTIWMLRARRFELLAKEPR